MRPSLSALLSWPLVALTIELDNEFEHRMAHRTTNRHPGSVATGGPWLTSFAMYANCVQFLGEEPISIGSLEGLARSETNLDGMRRWGYVRLSPPPDKPDSKRPNGNWMIALTRTGLLARDTWRPLPHAVEERWWERFGAATMESLREVLLQANQTFAVAFPDFLPILHYGLFTLPRGVHRERALPAYADAPLNVEAPLTALLSRLLYAFAAEFEQESAISLAISANVLRVLDAAGVPYRELPQRTGISKEAIAMAAGILRKAELILMGSGAGKAVQLTARGVHVQEAALERMNSVEQHWEHTMGRATLQRLRESLEHLAGDAQGGPALLLEGMKPYEDNWRAAVPAVQNLPHFPVVLHRGGFPDGS